MDLRIGLSSMKKKSQGAEKSFEKLMWGQTFSMSWSLQSLDACQSYHKLSRTYEVFLECGVRKSGGVLCCSQLGPVLKQSIEEINN